MSEYKRWISYIYNYDRGVKSTNAGYVRIESRVGKCRMTVNIKGGIAMGETLKIFLFYRNGADIIMVEAGQAGFYNGICEFCASTVVDNVFGSGMNIEQMSGVIAYSTIDRFYGSQWDDKPILLRRLMMHESYIQNSQTPSVLEINGEPVDIDDVKAYLRENENVNYDRRVETAKELPADANMKSGIKEADLWRGESEPPVTSYSMDNNDGAATGNDTDYNAGSVEDSITGGVTGNNVNSTATSVEGSAAGSITGSIADCREDNDMRAADDDIGIADEDMATAEGDLETGEDEAKMSGYMEDEPMSGALSRIFSKMPGMYPFEDDDVIECVKFDPQDIGMFPMEKWQLASNSFLLHGYYTYRHLIFARRRTVSGIKCMLGVPGMFRDREKFMAGMFGFGNFKGIRGRKNPGYGEFGYWYMDIDMK